MFLEDPEMDERLKSELDRVRHRRKKNERRLLEGVPTCLDLILRIRVAEDTRREDDLQQKIRKVRSRTRK